MSVWLWLLYFVLTSPESQLRYWPYMSSLEFDKFEYFHFNLTYHDCSSCVYDTTPLNQKAQPFDHNLDSNLKEVFEDSGDGLEALLGNGQFESSPFLRA